MTSGRCQHCGLMFNGHGNSKFCSVKCRSAAAYLRNKNSPSRRAIEARKMERYRNDPVYRAEIRARQASRARVAGTVAMEPVDKTCAGCNALFTGIPAKSYCSEPCKRRTQRKRQGKRAETPNVVLWAIARQYGEGWSLIRGPETIAISADVPVGVVPICPACGVWTSVPGPRPRDVDIRECRACRITLQLNSDDVAGVVWQRHGAFGAAG